MEPATTALLITLGINVLGRVTRFVCNELTEREKEKQAECEKHKDQYQKSLDKCSDWLNDPTNMASDPDLSEIYIKKQFELYQDRRIFVSQELDLRRNAMLQFQLEIKEAIKAMNSCLYNRDNGVLTPLRKASLELVLRQFYQAQAKCKGYITYLDKYKKSLDKIPLETDTMFSFCLPEHFPYIGKILTLPTVGLNQNGLCTLDVSNEISVSLFVCDEFERNLLKDQVDVAWMVESFDYQTYSYALNATKAKFYQEELTNTHLGVKAKVVQLEETGATLLYQNKLKLFLPKKSLEIFHFPPVGTEALVYPTYWKYALPPLNENTECVVSVSQRKQDALSSFSFSSFPFVVPSEKANELISEFTRRGVLNSTEQWFIGPVDEDQCSLHEGVELKLQLGSTPLFVVTAKQETFVADNQSPTQIWCLEYSRMCEEGILGFSASDLYVTFDTTLMPCCCSPQHWTSYTNVEDSCLFLWDIFEEIRVQKQLRNDRAGLSYFVKWCEITDQLIDYLKTNGCSFLVHFKEYSFAGAILKLTITNATQVAALIDACGQSRFLVRDDSSQVYRASFSLDCTELQIYHVQESAEPPFSNAECIVYAEDYPYCEIQQSIALRRFRNGQIENKYLQSAFLNGNSLVAMKNESVTPTAFYNQRITENEVQRNAVIAALQEENLFLIQGPPGTGKTTVICEIATQFLTATPTAHILIVSQANVAVDNALHGLLDQFHDKIIRCGHVEKIEPSLQPVSFEKQYNAYISQVETNKHNFTETLYQRWHSFIYPPNGKISELGRLLIKRNQIIGTTCIGLANRKIGLEEFAFDLVIIDEASKALPSEILIPLIRAKKVIMIGDHKQLPPVIHPALYDCEKIDLEDRSVVENELFEYSFFHKLYQELPQSNKVMLQQQFRMPAEIGTLVSNLFYDSLLKNGEGTQNRSPIVENHVLLCYDFSADKQYHEKHYDQSLINKREGAALLLLLKKVYDENPDCSIAVITPYRGQKRYLKSLLEKESLPNIEKIAIDTIDAFQGSEAELVVFCTTRAKKPTLFFKDHRRINVALSRATRQLIFLASLSYFNKYDKNESCLPSIAKHLHNSGQVIPSQDLFT